MSETKETENDVTFKLLPRMCVEKCEHKHILVDESLWTLTCEDCGEKIDPIAYIVKLANEEGMVSYRIDRLRTIEKEIIAKTICKCEHCGKMTHIPHKSSVY